MSERVGGEPVVKLCNLSTEFGIILRYVADVKLRIGGKCGCVMDSLPLGAETRTVYGREERSA